ncbi:unnamed protein product [Adineta steineri]|uniref:Uncharacterized protein n=1 Tax=Adineta steineri TaxID=433720 RepID=A0A813U134_9BILA|nr:unnamed protein product [Adineta steineri]CAF1296551.1 unnamed protein product [Adineta steineri]CAF1507333.1 unnamed protein product [Adineta steineri]
MVIPVGLFHDEPHILFLHLNVAINLHQHLHRYNDVVTVLNSENALFNRLAMPNQSFVIVALLPEQVLDRTHSFNQINFEPYATVDYIYLLYKKHPIYVTIKRDRFQQLKGWHSITDDTLDKIIWIVSKTLDRNVNYCNERACQSARDGNNGLAAIYEQQRLERNRLRIDAMQQLLDFI